MKEGATEDVSGLEARDQGVPTSLYLHFFIL